MQMLLYSILCFTDLENIINKLYFFLSPFNQEKPIIFTKTITYLPPYYRLKMYIEAIKAVSIITLCFNYSITLFDNCQLIIMSRQRMAFLITFDEEKCFQRSYKTFSKKKPNSIKFKTKNDQF